MSVAVSCDNVVVQSRKICECVCDVSVFSVVIRICGVARRYV